MAAKEISVEAALPPCGNCRFDLPPDRLVRAYIFDEIYELDERLRTGEVNLSICPHCGYRGWFWPGFLVVDRNKARSVFVVRDEFASGFDQVFNSSFDLLRAELDVTTMDKARENVVWVESYEHVYELLCEDEARFRREVESYAAYRKRAEIKDLTQRARQLVHDSLKIGAFLLRQKESDPEYVRVLLNVVRDELDTDHPERHLEALRQLLPMLTRAADSRPGHRGEPIGSDAVQRELLSREKVSEEQFRDSLSIIISREHRDRLDDSVEDARRIIDTLTDPVNSYSTIEPGLALRMLLAQGNSTQSWGRDHELKRWLSWHLKGAIELAPTVEIMHGDQRRSVAEALDLGMNGNVDMVSVTGNIALQGIIQDENLDFVSKLFCLFILKEKISSHYILRFYSLALCAEYLIRDGAVKLATGAYASAVMVLSYDGESLLQVPWAALATLAIVWQRLGRALTALGLLEAGALCAGISANVFKYAGRDDGEIRSRLDAINNLAQISVSSRVVNSAMELLAKVRKERTKESIGIQDLVDYEIECLSIIGQILSELSIKPPRWLEVDMKLEAEKIGSHAESEAFNALKLPIFDSDDSDTVLTEEQVAQCLKRTNSQNDGVLSDKGEANNEETSASGIIFLTKFTVGDTDAYIGNAKISGVAWYDALTEAAHIASKHALRERWFNLQMLLLERARKFKIPGVVLYLYRMFFERAKRHGFGEPGPEHLAILLPIILADVTAGGKRVTEGTLRSPEVERALEVAMTWLTDGTRPGGVDAFWSLSIGEVLEALGRNIESIHVYRMTRDAAEAGLRSASEASYRDALRAAIVGGPYRSARANIKHHKLTGEPSYLWAALTDIESYRSGVLGGNAKSRIASAEDLRYGFDGLERVAPSDTVLAIYALLLETDLNDGFWFVAFIDVASRDIFYSETLPFDLIYRPFEAVASAFDAERRSLEGKKIVFGISVEDNSSCAQLEVNLEKLADVLMPRTAVTIIERRHLCNLLFMPESYLFDVPFAALRVQIDDRRVYPFELNSDVGGTRLSVMPNCSTIRGEKFKDLASADIAERRVGAVLVTKPTWRSELTPLFGTRSRIDNFLKRVNASPPTELDISRQFRGETVADFLGMLRECQIGLFFGHGEIMEGKGSVLIAGDGLVGDLEVKQIADFERISCSLLLLCACSGINSEATLGVSRRELAGVHVALIRRGVRYVVGSVAPLFPIAALRLLESFAKGIEAGLEVDKILQQVYRDFAEDSALRTPVFWGHIAGFGDGRFSIHRGRQD